MSASLENLSVSVARDAVTIACRTHGRKRGWHLAAKLLGVSERVVKAIVYGEPARPDAIAAARARLQLAEQRLTQIEEEAAELRRLVDVSRQSLAVAGR